MDLTVEKLKAAFPDIYNAVLKEGQDSGYSKGLAEGTESGIKTGAEQERARIKGIEEGALPGHEALVDQMKYDGKTTPEQAAVRILGAEKTMRETKAEAFKVDAPPVVQPAVTVDKPTVPENPITEAEMKAAWDSNPALQAEYGTFDAYSAFVEADNKGLVKIYKGGN